MGVGDMIVLKSLLSICFRHLKKLNYDFNFFVVKLPTYVHNIVLVWIGLDLGSRYASMFKHPHLFLL